MGFGWLGNILDTVTKPLDWASQGLGKIPKVGGALSAGFDIGKYFIPGAGQYMAVADAANAVGDRLKGTGQPTGGGMPGFDDYANVSTGSSGKGFDWQKWLPYIYGVAGGVGQELGSGGQMQRALADMYKQNTASSEIQDKMTQEQIKQLQQTLARQASLDPLVADQMRSARTRLGGNMNTGFTSNYFNRG